MLACAVGMVQQASSSVPTTRKSRAVRRVERDMGMERISCPVRKAEAGVVVGINAALSVALAHSANKWWIAKAQGGCASGIAPCPERYSVHLPRLLRDSRPESHFRGFDGPRKCNPAAL